MKICIFSDIHGNLPAFEAAYPLIIKKSADVNLFLGDLCGYYFDEVVIWEKLITIPRLIAIRGNHDDMFIRAVDGDGEVLARYRKLYGPALDIFLKKDYRVMISWLRDLPFAYIAKGNEWSAYHGSPWNVLQEYIYPDASLYRFEKAQGSWIFLGHTHYAMNRCAGNTKILNPGSLGQPRDGHWPQFAVIDLEKNSVDFHQVSYDKNLLLREMRQNFLQHPYLSKIIEKIGSCE